VLTPPHRGKTVYLTGVMSFLASSPSRTPAISPVIWKKFETYRSVRELFDSCGRLQLGSPKIDPAVRAHLGSQAHAPAPPSSGPAE
jgi:hypothetical protein